VSKKVLITGAGGQVGHELKMATSPYELIALTRNELDITQQDEVAKTVKKYNPDIIINAAAYTAVDKAEEESNRAFAINCDGVKNLAIACAENNIPLLHISTDYVFNGEKLSAYSEADPIAPLGVYGKSKAEGEAKLRELLPEHIILRTSWVFSSTGNNFVKTMLRLGKERVELSVVSDQQGCPTSAQSIAMVLLDIAQQYFSRKKIPWGTYHYCNQPPTTWYDFASSIFDIAAAIDNRPVPKLNAIPTSEYPTPAQRPTNSVLDCRKIEKAFGIVRRDWKVELTNIQL
jgi:dTDP-4-dehydrorhamnose reductase